MTAALISDRDVGDEGMIAVSRHFANGEPIRPSALAARASSRRAVPAERR